MAQKRGPVAAGLVLRRSNLLELLDLPEVSQRTPWKPFFLGLPSFIVTLYIRIPYMYIYIYMIVSIINMYIYIYPIPGSLKFLKYYVFGIPENM